MRDMVQRVLERDGYIVEWAADAVTALARINAGGIDLILLDVLLPGSMGGLELCRLVRERQRPDDVYLPIILLTGLGGSAQQHAGFATGADDYVTKPFPIQELRDRVGVWVRTRRRLQASHDRLVQEQERLCELEKRAAQDEAVLAMARTASDQLAQPLTVLVGRLDLARTERCPVQHIPTVWAELEQATAELAARLDRLGRVIRYETKQVGSLTVIDLARAHERAPGVICHAEPAVCGPPRSNAVARGVQCS